MFNYLPPKKMSWETHLERQRNNYENLIRDLVIPPGFKEIDLKHDHPLSEGPDSTW